MLKFYPCLFMENLSVYIVEEIKPRPHDLDLGQYLCHPFLPLAGGVSAHLHMIGCYYPGESEIESR